MSNTSVIIPNGYSGMTQITQNSSYPITRAYTNTSSTTYTQLNLSKKNSTGSVDFDGFDFSNIPTKATIVSVTIKVKCMVNSTSYITSASVQAYKNTVAVGSSTNFRTTSATTYTLNIGSWTRSELEDLKIHFQATRGNTNSTSYMRIYGMDVTVVWDEPTEQMYTKTNGVWVPVMNVYKKINGVWVLQDNLADIFNENTNYLKA